MVGELAESVENDKVGEGEALSTFRPELASQGVALTPYPRSGAALQRKLDREARAKR
jgi:hypothetical protein